MITGSEAMQAAGLVINTGCAATCTLAAVWLSQRPMPWRRERIAGVAALCFTALWAGVLAGLGPDSLATGAVQSIRNLSWLALIHALFAGGVDRESAQRVRFVIASLVFVELLQCAILASNLLFDPGPGFESAALDVSALLHMLVAIGALVLLHNLYIGASHRDRAGTRWAALALSALWVFELNHYAVTWFAGDFPSQIAVIKSLVVAIAFIPLAMSLGTDVRGLKFRASRKVAFRSLSLLLIGAYLLAMAGIARLLSMLDADGARLAQVGFLVALLTVMALWLPSARFRAWLRVTLQKHLFSHRYDYRTEWLQLADTIGRGVDEGDGLHVRIPKAMADITESPSAALFLTDGDGTLALAEAWRWPTLEEQGTALPSDVTQCLADRDYVIDLEEWRGNTSPMGEVQKLPSWLDQRSRAWAIVPLRHFDRLQGAVLLARPLIDRQLDWEDFDLLTAVGRQLASYLAEQTSQRALMEAARFDEFNRRIAFVLHDIKNLASQLSLLSHNAQRHADNPAFRADMLKTLGTSTDKLNALIQRLGRYGPARDARLESFDLATLIRELGPRFAERHRVEVAAQDVCIVRGDRDGLEQALIHLIQNAVDASPPAGPVCVSLRSDAHLAHIEIVDVGEGMDPAFLRDKLFEPFVTSKPDGFGIGAFEARELVRAMGGRLMVQSRVGLGTRFIIDLPRVAPAELPGETSSREAA
ncbi:XrtA/PEP-CTERM system histidine kinase PrsK [Alteriqipengyuania lutimaris]|uniref:histidine kinase n=1 Tax=Alteriqipengyuania lutimaris TaxID=1538146 RepID=A0A395LLJ1_9SPHN|nr:XrtA/PEP-CTERM system histidine kinase PrsK [Alteriqipengyuania lutimaris]MBB3033035.1 putative PEP-CTERM system histidine kinase [Alteriqipengyuania lutimaris]RDS77893.1 PEP-CTERM system histidine kinase PrsK [Alteriqipengyuania lutimaris]